jgi:hypothetical protein
MNKCWFGKEWLPAFVLGFGKRTPQQSLMLPQTTPLVSPSPKTHLPSPCWARTSSELT